MGIHSDHDGHRGAKGKSRGAVHKDRGQGVRVADLAVEKNELENVYNDMLFLRQAFRDSRDLVSMLRSPIIKADKKGKVLDAIGAGRISVITASFNKLLLTKEREAYLPEIVIAFIEQYKIYKGIQTVKLTTATPVSEELKQAIDKVIQKKNDI